MGAGASVLCGGQRRLLVPVALIVSTSEPFHSHVGVRALENMERVFVSPYQFQFKPSLFCSISKLYAQGASGEREGLSSLGAYPQRRLARAKTKATERAKERARSRQSPVTNDKTNDKGNNNANDGKRHAEMLNAARQR